MKKESKEGKRSRYDKRKFFVTFLCVMGVFAAVRYVFSINIPLYIEEKAVEEKQEFVYIEPDVPAEQPIVEPIATEKDEATEETEEIVTDSLQIEDVSTNVDSIDRSHRIKGVWSYKDCFPDVQDVQILAAQQYGITPVRNRQEADILVRNHKLVNICHSPYYIVDDLTHSIPYLVPKAQHLLNTICMNFLDSCQVKGLPPHLLMVTSVLRTTDDVSNLQKGNKNATTNSCHCYGTTVDIAYNRFMPITGEHRGYEDLLRWDEPMKKVLSEVLYDLRMQGKCYVKYEVKQGCFHLTCR